jgi:hypothetical protein
MSMMNHALPIWQQIALDLFAPPIITALWWLKSRDWAEVVHRGDISETTKHRQNKGFWIVLGVLYLIAFAVTAYFNIIP